MGQINKIKVQDEVLLVSQSPNAIMPFTSDDSLDPSQYQNVSLLSSGETNSSIFAKISQMFKNIRFLYSRLGTTDISGVGSTVTAAISALNSGKANVSHTHSVSELPVSDQQINSSSSVPTSSLIYQMNEVISQMDQTLHMHDGGVEYDWRTHIGFGMFRYVGDGMQYGAPENNVIVITFVESSSYGAAMALRWKTSGNGVTFYAALEDETGQFNWGPWIMRGLRYSINGDSLYLSGGAV